MFIDCFDQFVSSLYPIIEKRFSNDRSFLYTKLYTYVSKMYFIFIYKRFSIINSFINERIEISSIITQ